MRKYLYIIICTICLGFSTVPARANVTNQLDEILLQLENLDEVLQFFVDNEAYLEYWLQGEIFTDYLDPTLAQIQSMYLILQQFMLDLETGIMPDISSIQADVADISTTVLVFFSEFVESVNMLSYDISQFHGDFLSAMTSLLTDTALISGLLTANDLDYQLSSLLSGLTNYFDENMVLFEQILNTITSGSLEAALQELRQAILSLETIGITLNLQDELENLDLSGLFGTMENDINSILSLLTYLRLDFEYLNYNFDYFLSNFTTLQSDQLHMFGFLTEFINWYQGYFFEGMQEWGTRHSVWMTRIEDILQSQAEYGTNQMQFLTGDYYFPTDSEEAYLVELEEAIAEEEPEIPDEKIYAASDEVETDMEDVEHELTGAMDLVDSAFTGFLGDVQFNWGSFNPVMSFSYTLPFHDYTMELTYDFSESDLRAPCRTASTGIWSIVLFVQSFLAISGALRGVTEN